MLISRGVKQIIKHKYMFLDEEVEAVAAAPEAPAESEVAE